MCEYTPGCTLSDDPRAAQLWDEKSRTQALKRAKLVFRCHAKKHPVGAVFDLPGRGEVLLSPHQKMLARSVFADPVEPDALVHQHAALIPVAQLQPGALFQGRCACGQTWSFDVLKALARSRPWGRDGNGVPYMIGNFVATADDEAAKRFIEIEQARHADHAGPPESTTGQASR